MLLKENNMDALIGIFEYFGDVDWKMVVMWIIGGVLIYLAIAKQMLEERHIVRCRDDENISNTRQHQHRDRIVYHRLIVDRQELLAYSLGYWVESCTTTTC